METDRQIVRIRAFEVERRPDISPFGRRLPTLFCERLACLSGLKPALDLDAGPNHESAGWVVTGEFFVDPERRNQGGELGWNIKLRDETGLFRIEKTERFASRDLYRKIDRLVRDVAKVFGLEPPKSRPIKGPRTFAAIRDYLRATDLDDGRSRLEMEDRRLALDWLLLSVESDPQFCPARDALLESVLRAHAAGLLHEARKTLFLAARLAPKDARVPFVLGELSFMDERPDEAIAAYRRCLGIDSQHADAHYKLGLLLDREGDRDAAKRHFLIAGRKGRPEALLLRGILCAEDGEMRKAKAAWLRAKALDPSGGIGARAESQLLSLTSERTRRRVDRGAP